MHIPHIIRHDSMSISVLWKRLIIVLYVTGVIGCAADIPTTPDYFSIEYELLVPEIHRIALVTDLTPPEIESVDFGITHGQGALHGAGRGAMGGAAVALEVGGVAGILLVPFFMLGGSVVGTVSGATSGYSAEMLAEAEASAQYMLNSAYLQTQILERVKDYGHDNTNLEFIRMSCADQESLADKPDYTALLDESIDIVLEVELLRLALEDSLKMDARVRLVSAQTGAVLSDSQYRFFSEHHKLKEWLADGAAPLTEAIQRGLKTLAEDIIDENFLLFYPYEPEKTPLQQVDKTNEQVDETWDVRVPHYVLSPVYPALESCVFCGEFPFGSVHRTISNLEFVEVDSVQPTLRWESFPRDHDMIEADGQKFQITDVRYDLRVFDKVVMPSSTHMVLVPAQQVYGVRDIPESYHRIESGLNTCHEYFWTVRARFNLDGRVRVTEWAGYYRWPAQHPWNLRHGQHAYRDPGPEWFYYPFKTPCDSKNIRELKNSDPLDDEF
jgi:hypothetical protein